MHYKDPWWQTCCEAVIRRFEEHRQGIRELNELLRGKKQLTGDERAKARAMMRALKERLGEDLKRGATAKGLAAMNCYEQEYLHPTVVRAMSNLRFRWNSDPVRSRWLAGLAAAESEVVGYLELLKIHLETMVEAWGEHVIPPEGMGPT